MSCSSRELFKENLAVYLKRAKMNQSQLAKELGVSKATVSCWLSGKAFPRIDTMQQMADCLNCTVGQLTTSQKGRIPHAIGRTQSSRPLQKASVLQAATPIPDVLQAKGVMGINEKKIITIKTVSRPKGCLPDKILNSGVFEVQIKGKSFDNIAFSQDSIAGIQRDTSEILKLMVQMSDEQRVQAIRAVKRVQKRGSFNKGMLEVKASKK